MKTVAKNRNTYGGIMAPGVWQPNACAGCKIKKERMEFTSYYGRKFWGCGNCGQLHETEQTQGFAGFKVNPKSPLTALKQFENFVSEL